jgi:hypothetical protein
VDQCRVGDDEEDGGGGGGGGGGGFSFNMTVRLRRSKK